MTDTNTQAVVDETKAPPKADVAVDSARDDGDLQSILNGYEEATKAPEPPKPAPAVQTPAAPDPNVALLLARENNRDINDAVKAIRGSHPVSERIVKGWLNAAADENPKLKDIFDNRLNNPSQWEKTLKALTKEFDKENAKRPDTDATADREAVSHAMRNASTKAPEEKPADLKSMTNGEYRQHVREKYGFEPPV